jgi:cellulose synthase (UDP-forming)
MDLPVPPRAPREKYGYVDRRRWTLTIGTVLSVPFLVVSQIGFVAVSPRLWILAPFLALGPTLSVLGLLLDAFTRDFNLSRHLRLIDGWQPQHYPSVDVMLPTCGERIEVLHNTWRYVAALRAHYRGIVRVYVLDDSCRPAVAAMAADFGFECFVRPHRGWLKKAGNLYHGLCNSGGEYILILDADFVPRPDMLDETLPYFDADPRVGILQTPQYFLVDDDQTWVERAAAAVQELFYRSIQVTRDRWGAVVCCGTNAVYRRAALEDNAGITLIAHSEDIHTGLELRALGWKVRYLPVVLASGKCPADVRSFFEQQYRWCMGTLTITLSRKFWAAKVSLPARLCYLSGFLYYLETAAMVFLAPLIGIVLCTEAAAAVESWNYLLIMPSIVFAFVVTPLWHRCAYRVETWSVKLVYGWAHVFAIWDHLRGREMSWQPTGSGKVKADTSVRRFWIGFWCWSVGTAVAWLALAGWRTMTRDVAAFAPILIAGVFYAVTVLRVAVPARVGRGGA